MNCPNCDSKLSCGCQKRRASDGKDVCTNCLTLYESGLTNAKTKDISVDSTTAPTDLKITVTQKPIDSQ